MSRYISSKLVLEKKCRRSDHNFTLKTLIDKALKSNKSLFSCFVDLSKAFDMVNTAALLFELNSTIL